MLDNDMQDRYKILQDDDDGEDFAQDYDKNSVSSGDHLGADDLIGSQVNAYRAEDINDDKWTIE